MPVVRLSLFLICDLVLFDGVAPAKVHKYINLKIRKEIGYTGVNIAEHLPATHAGMLFLCNATTVSRHNGSQILNAGLRSWGTTTKQKSANKYKEEHQQQNVHQSAARRGLCINWTKYLYLITRS